MGSVTISYSGIDASDGGSGSIAVNSGDPIFVGKAITGSSGTLFITGTNIVPASVTLNLSVSSDENAAIILAEPVGGPSPQFIDSGTVDFTATAANDPLIAFNDGDGGNQQGLIYIAKGASFTESSTGAGSYASGYISDDWAASFDNDGTFSITAAAQALGLDLQDNANGSVINAGLFSITGATAIGVEVKDPGQITNTGDFEVHGTTSAIGIEIETTPNNGQVTNNGMLNVQASAGTSEGIVLDYGPYDEATIVNNGTITAQKAITLGLGTFANNGDIFVSNNSGATINGDIDLGVGSTAAELTNDGAINGAIHLENSGDNLYTGYAGTLTGPIYLGSGNSDIFLGNDGETVYGGSGTAYVQLGAGNDTIVAGSGAVQVSYGTAASGVTIDLADNNPQNTGGGGTDTLEGVTSVIGSAFNDTLTAAPDGSTLQGGAGNDILITGSGSDALDGGAGVDTAVFDGAASGYVVTQSNGTTTVTGDGQTDTLTNVEILQFSDTQQIISSVGETLTARAGGDNLIGGSGDDTFIAGSGTGTIDGGAGNDLVVFSGAYSAYNVSQNTSYTTVSGPAGGGSLYDTLFNVEVLEFTDRQMVTSFSGGATLTARPGGDTLIGGVGDDTFITGTGDDYIDSTLGTDTVVFSHPYSAYSMSNEPSGLVVTGPDGVDTLERVSILVFSDRQVAIVGDGPTGETLTARAGGDILVGSAGADTLISGAGNDTLDGGDGNDTAVFSGSYSAYTIIPTAGGYTISGPQGTDTIKNIETLKFADQTVQVSSLAAPTGETLTGTPGNDVLVGGDGNDTFIATTGNDTIDGGGGIDTVVFSEIYADYTQSALPLDFPIQFSNAQGSTGLKNVEIAQFADRQMALGSAGVSLTARAGGDALYGGTGNDTLIGGAGNDILSTGGGTDSLDGGGGTNTAVFDWNYGAYTITQAGGTTTVTETPSASSITGDAETATLANIQILQFSDRQMVLGSAGQTLTARNLIGESDTLGGGAGNDVLHGGGVAIGGGGNDTIDDANMAVFSSAYSLYTVSHSGGVTTVSGPDGVDALTNVNILEFADRQVAIGTGGVTLTARDGGDILVAGPGIEQLNGAGGDDTFIVGSGNEDIDGGGGNNTAVFSGDLAAYSISKSGAYITVSTQAGFASLTNVGTLQFADQTISAADISNSLNLTGTSGPDTLTGGAGADTISGLGGNDVLDGGGGNDTLDGGSGVDTAVFSAAHTAYTVTPVGGGYTVSGPDGTDTLTNIEILRFDDAQMVIGSAGETLTARAGGDTLIGGAGNDTLTGGAGADTLIVGTGNDTVNGGGGADTAVFSGDYSAYQLNELNSVVTVVGPNGTDTLSNVENLQFADQAVAVSSLTNLQGLVGTSGNDTLTAGATGTTLYGLAGNDTLKGGAGADILDGGPGNDVLNGGGGVNTATYADATSGVTVSLKLTTAQNTGGSGTDTLTSVQNLIGSAYNDTLTAGGSGSVLQGMAGDDVLIGGPGNDTLDGGAGNNTASYALATSAVTVSLAISGQQNTIGAGKDTLVSIETLIGSNFNDTLTAGARGSNLQGGGGNDTLITGPGVDTIDGGAGTDTVVFSGHAADYAVVQNGGTTTVTGDGQTDTLTNVEVLRFADEQMVLGTAGASITARAAGDTLIGGPGNDTLTGGAGSDVLDGGPGNDILKGGAGIDTATYADATSGVTVSLALTTAQNSGGAGTDTLATIENLTGSAFNDTLTAAATGSVLQGMGGNDILISGPGNDTLNGGDGTDTASYATAKAAVTVSLAISGQQNTIGAGKDTLVSIETLIGSNFNDTLTAGASGSNLQGGGGNDTLIAGPGVDTIDGGAGTDTVVFSGHAADYLVSQNGGTTTVTGDGQTDTLTNVEVLRFADEQMVLGTAGASITARAAGDTLIGGPGNDTLTGGVGSDVLDGGPGNDILKGGAGIDTATYADATSGVTVSLALTTAQNSGGAGTDTLATIENLTGSAFNDTLTAAATGSVLQGMGGNDILISGPGNDTLNGGDGTDTASYATAKAAVTVSLAISGQQNTIGAGKDTLVSIETLVGSNYNDTLTAGANGSNLQGGAGNDILVSGPGNDTFDGGAGTDTAVFSSPYADYSIVRHDATTTTVTGPDGTDFLSNVEILKFTDEQVVNSDLGQTLTARAGGDILVGNQGNDVLKGGAGNDVLIGNGGNDSLNGGGGYNTAIFNGDLSAYTIKPAGGATTVKGPDGTDTVSQVQVLQFEDAQAVAGSAGGTLTARAAGDTLVGGAGADILISGPGNDTLNGGAGTDTAVFSSAYADYSVVRHDATTTTVTGPDGTDFLSNVEILKFTDEQVVNSDLGQTLTARAGGDILVGNQGADHLNGGAGNDVLIGNAGNDVLNGGGGYNTAIFNGDLSAYKLTSSGGAITQVKGPDGTDTLAKIQVLQFDDAQVLNVSTGAELVARAGGDKLVGGAGADHLVGGAGNDVLTGGAGQDTLTGGGGHDSFVFTALTDSKVTAPDLITDWASGDKIDLSAIDADATHAGVQAFHFGATAGHTGDIVVTYDATHNRTVVDLYVNGDAKADAEIWLTGHQTLGAGDFVL